ncbi:MAG: hypothetical protein KGR26_09935, partial [Cyanobacteria bacterium REEB65]|nr:hypothetical protein [Cyanobacteria bacterium REEB65]
IPRARRRLPRIPSKPCGWHPRMAATADRLGDQRGQAMVYVAILLAVLVGVLYSTYDVARMISAKIQAQNAADAAALAAASVKVSVHNTRTLAYAAMTTEAALARIDLAEALIALGAWPASEAQFTRAMSSATDHLDKLQELRAGLKAYNHWVGQAGPQIVADAARIAYAANIAGANGNSGGGAAANTANLHLLDGPANLVENSADYQQGEFIGGFNYRGESAGPDGDAGKTFVEVKPDFVPTGGGWLGGSSPMELPALAAAGPVPASQIAKVDPGEGDLSLFHVAGLHWYAPRLFAIGNVPGMAHAVLH